MIQSPYLKKIKKNTKYQFTTVLFLFVLYSHCQLLISDLRELQLTGCNINNASDIAYALAEDDAKKRTLHPYPTTSTGFQFF